MNQHILNTSVDKTQIPPLHQKRILAFVNHFVINSCSFLNDFASKCETKFIEVERKMQKVEASLIIIEAKLYSIPSPTEPKEKQEAQPISSDSKETLDTNEIDNDLSGDDKTNVTQDLPKVEAGVRACEDARYKKFFKMIHVGVPMNAVKIKMQAEGVDPSVIEYAKISASIINSESKVRLKAHEQKN